MKLKIETIGDETVVLLPGTLVARLKLGEGVSHLEAELVNGAIELKVPDPTFDRATASTGEIEKA